MADNPWVYAGLVLFGSLAIPLAFLAVVEVLSWPGRVSDHFAARRQQRQARPARCAHGYTQGRCPENLGH